MNEVNLMIDVIDGVVVVDVFFSGFWNDNSHIHTQRQTLYYPVEGDVSVGDVVNLTTADVGDYHITGSSTATGISYEGTSDTYVVCWNFN